MMITRKELAGFTISLTLLAAAAACSSESAPPSGLSGATSVVDTSGKGNEVNRSDPTATANAFASMYAAGNLPGACQLANDDGRTKIDSKCERQQAWNTTVTLVSSCETTTFTPAQKEVPATGYHFEAPVQGSLDRNGDLMVWLTQDPTTQVWSVANANTPSSEDSSLICRTTASASASSAPRTTG